LSIRLTGSVKNMLLRSAGLNWHQNVVSSLEQIKHKLVVFCARHKDVCEQHIGSKKVYT